MSPTTLAPLGPAWPAVPYTKPVKPPVEVEEYFPKPEVPIVSKEPLERSQTEKPPKPVATDWRPLRPARPPSPRLEHSRTLSHSLSQELVNHLKSPPQSPAQDQEREKEGRTKRRSNSISLKGLRHQMSAKNINNAWKKDEKDRPELPSRTGSETVGLFKGAVAEPANPSTVTRSGTVASGKSSMSSNGLALGEFGTINPTTPTSPILNFHAVQKYKSRIRLSDNTRLLSLLPQDIQPRHVSRQATQHIVPRDELVSPCRRRVRRVSRHPRQVTLVT